MGGLVPQAALLTFQYVFASEEYNEYANTRYNDTFAFFVNGTNCATVPGTVPPKPVSINTINGGNPFGTNAQNPAFYRNNDLSDGGVPLELAGELADLDALVSAPDIVTVAARTNRAIGDTSTTFFAAETNFRLDRIIAAARSVPANDYFERLAIDRALDQVAAAERRLVADMLATGQSGQQAAENWLAAHPEAIRIRRSVEEIAASGLTLAKLTVAANLLGDLVKG